MAEESALQATNDIQNAHIYNADVGEPSRNKLLMDTVRKYRAIYDKSYPEYKNQKTKNNAWQAVAQDLECI